MAYFRFDHRGCDRSQGEFEQITSLAARCRDLRMAIAVIENHSEVGNRIVLFGSSMGGTVCLTVAAELKVRTIIYAGIVRAVREDVRLSVQRIKSGSAQVFR